MRIAKLILGAIAAVGLARLLAPRETQEVVENAKRALQRGMNAAGRSADDMSAMSEHAFATAAGRTKSAARTVARKTSRTARKAAKRPRKAST